MAVMIRLARVGRKKRPHYRVVVTDARSPRDSGYIEAIGRYDPLSEPSMIEIDKGKALAWLAKGAQPSNTVKRLMEKTGILAETSDDSKSGQQQEVTE